MNEQVARLFQVAKSTAAQTYEMQAMDNFVGLSMRKVVEAYAVSVFLDGYRAGQQSIVADMQRAQATQPTAEAPPVTPPAMDAETRAAAAADAAAAVAQAGPHRAARRARAARIPGNSGGKVS